MIKELEDTNYSTHLLITGSNLAELYVYDKLKSVCKADLNSIITIDSSSKFKEMLELVNVPPFLADRWLFVINYHKVKKMLETYKHILKSNIACFLIKVDKYVEFLEVKKLVSKVNELYLSFLKYSDVHHLLYPYKMPKPLVDYIANAYGKEPEQIFKLLKELEIGRVVENKKEVIEICGQSMGNIQYFVMSMLKTPPTTEKGKAKVYKNRIRVASDLADVYTINTFRNYTRACVKDLIYIKMMYINCDIYNRIWKLPEKFDEKKLSRYNSILNSIKEIPYERLVRLYNCLLGDRWESINDIVCMVYRFYGER